MTTPSQLRSTARAMEKSASEIEMLETAIRFLSKHADLPHIEIYFPGHRSDGDVAALALSNDILKNWSERRVRLIEQFTILVGDAKGAWE